MNTLVITLTLAALALIVTAKVALSRRAGSSARNPANVHSRNQSWVVKKGSEIIKKSVMDKAGSLTDWERLVYCLWIADYMMRNAGDFENARVMYPNFQSDAAQIATSLGLVETHRTFSLSRVKLQRDYFARFEKICDEIKCAQPNCLNG